MLKIHDSSKNDHLTTILRYVVSGFLSILSLSCLFIGVVDHVGWVTILPAVLNFLFWGAIAYGVFTQPHKYSSLAVVFLIMTGTVGASYSHMYLTEPIEGRESLFTSLTQWYLVFSFVLVACISSVILYFRSRYLYTSIGAKNDA